MTSRRSTQESGVGRIHPAPRNPGGSVRRRTRRRGAALRPPRPPRPFSNLRRGAGAVETADEGGHGEGDIVVKEHWAQSGFADTDLDQQLRQHGITHVIVIGLLANTRIKPTARYAMELGFHVTLVRDGTAAFTKGMVHAAHVLNGSTYAHAILDTRELVEALPNGQG